MLAELKVAAFARTQKPMGHGPLGGKSKRLTDFVLATVGIFLLAPILLLTAVAIWVTEGRPIFFGHPRLGFDGRTFICWKFRTMASNGAEIIEKYLAANPAEAKEWEARRGKLQRDPRVTSLGRFLRSTSIDELPQLLNVLTGTMSVVGPRPLPLEEVPRYGDLIHYCSVRPGLTGLWQVSGHHAVSYEERIRLDTRYALQWTFGLDVVIIAKTLPALLQQSNF